MAGRLVVMVGWVDCLLHWLLGYLAAKREKKTAIPTLTTFPGPTGRLLADLAGLRARLPLLAGCLARQHERAS